MTPGQQIVNQTFQNSTSIVAAGAVVSPWWLPTLEGTSQIAGQLVPIAGFIWLALQIVGYLIRWYKGRK